MIILRTGEERKSYRVLMVKENQQSETKFAVQKKSKFLYFFTKWTFVKDQDDNVKIFDSNKNAVAYINFKSRW
jgi:hypothetical protein